MMWKNKIWKWKCLKLEFKFSSKKTFLNFSYFGYFSMCCVIERYSYPFICGGMSTPKWQWHLTISTEHTKCRLFSWDAYVSKSLFLLCSTICMKKTTILLILTTVKSWILKHLNDIFHSSILKLIKLSRIYICSRIKNKSKDHEV